MNVYSHLSVRALLWLSRAAWRSLSRRFFSVSSFSASLGSRRCRGLTYCSSFSSSSFSLMRMRRSRSGSSSPGQASLSSLAIWTSMVAILRKRGGRCEVQRCVEWDEMWIQFNQQLTSDFHPDSLVGWYDNIMKAHIQQTVYKQTHTSSWPPRTSDSDEPSLPVCWCSSWTKHKQHNDKRIM